MSLGGSTNPPRQTMGVWMQTPRCIPSTLDADPPMQTSLDADPPGCRPPGCSPTWIQTPCIQTPRYRPPGYRLPDADPWMQNPDHVTWNACWETNPTLPPWTEWLTDALKTLPSLAVGKDTFCNQVSTRSNLLMSTIKTSTLPSVRIPPSGPSLSDKDNFWKFHKM